MSAEKKLAIEKYSSYSPLDQEEIIKSYIPLVKRVVHRLAGRLPKEVDLKEMLNSGLIGLVDALEKYDSTRENSFATYAQFRIRGAILDSFRAQDWLPRSMRQKAHQVEKAYRIVEQKLGRSATDLEVATELNLDLEAFRKQLSDVSNAVMYSFEELGYGHGDDRFTGSSWLNNTEKNPLEQAIHKERVELLSRALERLSYKERLVVTLHFYEELSLREIGSVLELTESRISQIRTRALIRLKNSLKTIARGQE